MHPPLAKDPIAEIQKNWERHGWETAAAPAAAVTAIMRTQQILLGRAQEILKPFELTFARYEVISLLSFSREKRMPMNKASKLLQVHPTSITNAVDRLESAGLMERQPHESDRRAVLLVLTAKGKQVAGEATRALNEQLFEQTGFTPEEVAELNRILAKFRQRAGDFEA
ncbi:MarR family winged helix-turn-helix transcriptional regulator [Nesterenkonia alkaliphila]|uniref:MarR family transcriptional regulator n=1 Tax=Nesterenkonia alkaliphila TaxID=1463631 RepID=A0A7K1UJQ3_9MICC|nr:MarR family transcriptional regulator [Nesterenkonia alkaliphila]MVT26725.1 MarR family transcriptional regulator [Nesterenkonia alkaliphila]GFZ76999.1 putative transcriptional regulator, MarR family protein [Nesterenkonia alkaliphila]